MTRPKALDDIAAKFNAIAEKLGQLRTQIVPQRGTAEGVTNAHQELIDGIGEDLAALRGDVERNANELEEDRK